jgi:hypothetical protein
MLSYSPKYRPTQIKKNSQNYAPQKQVFITLVPKMTHLHLTPTNGRPHSKGKINTHLNVTPKALCLKHYRRSKKSVAKTPQLYPNRFLQTTKSSANNNTSTTSG